MQAKVKYEFKALVWQHGAAGGWWFVSLPISMSEEIRTHFGWQETGWGRLQSTIKIGSTTWNTSIWFDKKHQTYLLPIKAIIRTSEPIVLNQEVAVSLWV